MIIPSVMYRGDNSPQLLDIFSRLLRDRAIMLSGEINDVMSDMIVGQLFHLESEDPELDINIYINSPGGSVTSAFAMYDAMRYIKPNVNTICIGQACSAASLILCAGHRRFISANSRVLLHQPSGSVSGQASDLRIQAREIDRIYDIIEKIYLDHTKIPADQLRSRYLDRDMFLSAVESKELGLVDDILVSRKENNPNNIVDINPNLTKLDVKHKRRSKEKDDCQQN